MCDNPNCTEDQCSVPYGACHCEDCDQQPTLVKNSWLAGGLYAGHPSRYVARHQNRKKLEDRFDISKDGCWVWNGAMVNSGYGVYTAREEEGGRSVRMMAHRVMYERLVGPIPDGLDLDHLCRNRACVNPDHVEPVTNAENARRGAKSKLTKEIVRQLRADPPEPGADKRKRAEILGVSLTTLQDALKGKTWQNI